MKGIEIDPWSDDYQEGKVNSIVGDVADQLTLAVRKTTDIKPIKIDMKKLKLTSEMEKYIEAKISNPALKGQTARELGAGCMMRYISKEFLQGIPPNEQQIQHFSQFWGRRLYYQNPELQNDPVLMKKRLKERMDSWVKTQRFTRPDHDDREKALKSLKPELISRFTDLSLQYLIKRYGALRYDEKGDVIGIGEDLTLKDKHIKKFAGGTQHAYKKAEEAVQKEKK